MTPALARALEAALGARAERHRPLGGGSINQAFAVSLADGRAVFVKTRADAGRDTFPIEAEGLSWLHGGLAGAREASLFVPEVLALLDEPPALVLAAFEPGPRTTASDEALGRGLARLHASLTTGARFGLHRANDLATIRLENAFTEDWPTFYAERRLLPLLARAERRGLATTRMRRGLERVIARLPELAGPPERAARLHGDLWAGNAAVDRAGRPVIFDPAVFAGHREIGLAMMTLFGGFSERVLCAYDELWPRAPGHAERLPLYLLLPLLAHVVLFGAAYVGQVEAALDGLG
jgi:fructosamine-3-kinase